MVLGEYFNDAEWSAANSENIDSAVRVAFCDLHDFSGATHARDSLVQGGDHAEFRVLFQAVFDHLAVTRLESMQGDLRSWNDDDVQRKQRNAFRPHGSQSTSYQRGGPVVI